VKIHTCPNCEAANEADEREGVNTLACRECGESLEPRITLSRARLAEALAKAVYAGRCIEQGHMSMQDVLATVNAKSANSYGARSEAIAAAILRGLEEGA
jgi:hypothetical protein